MLREGLQEATGGLPPPGPGVEWEHGVNTDNASTGPLMILVAPDAARSRR